MFIHIVEPFFSQEVMTVCMILVALAADRLQLHCSSSVHLSEMQKTTVPIYFRVFFMARSFWVDNAHLFHFFYSTCHVCWNRQKPDSGLLYLITWPSANFAAMKFNATVYHGHVKPQFNYSFFCCCRIDPQILWFLKYRCIGVFG